MNLFRDDFAKELRRPFAVAEGCYDCAEFYHGCNAMPSNTNARCLDYLRLPDVGVNGATGQEIPESRMASRKDPRVRLPNGAPARAREQTEKPSTGRTRRARPQPVEQDPFESGWQTAPEDSGPLPAIDTPAEDRSTEQPTKQARQPSPAGNPGPDGARFCMCGAVLKERERCCAACRLQRRKDALERYRSQARPPETGQTT